MSYGLFVHTFPTPQEMSNNPNSGNFGTAIQAREWLSLLLIAPTLDGIHDLWFLSNPNFQRLYLVVLPNLNYLLITQAISFLFFVTFYQTLRQCRNEGCVFSKRMSFPRGAGMLE